MENKLQQLTAKLYDEGLEKGRKDAERMTTEAKAEAAKIVATAKAKAEQIIAEAEAKAADTEKNSMTEIALAGKQALAKIKTEIAEAIVAKTTAETVHKVNLEPEFTKEMLLAVAKNWNGAAAAKVELKALLPEKMKTELDTKFAAVTAALLTEGIEVGYSKEVRTGFKVGAKKGGYYISFSDESFDALVGSYLREKVAELLYK